MATYLVTHDVDDVDHWVSSTVRAEALATVGVTARTFRGAPDSTLVGLILEIPDLAAFQEFMGSPAAADAMKADGVRPETLVLLSQS